MIEILSQYIESETSVENKINRLREALQLICLKLIQDKGYFSGIAFVGGTALRIIYGIRRFSEDLDFSVVDRKEYDFSKMLLNIEREFRLAGLEIVTNPKIDKAVQSGMLKFPGLLKIMKLSEMKDQRISVKLEVDSNPPAGWQEENTVVNKMYVLNIRHFALPSLFATKLHACFFRRYHKGRDFYDLVWYLGKKVKPNYELLNNAIMQTEGKDLALSEKNIENFLIGQLDKIDFNTIRKDVERFLEDKSELKLLERAVIVKSIEDLFGQ